MSEWSEVVDVSGLLGDVFDVANTKFLELGTLSIGSQVLEVACGTGGLSRLAHGRVTGKGGRVVGVDQSEAMTQAAEAQAVGLEGAQYVTGDAARIGGWGETFDAAFCRFGMPYFAQPKEVLKACHDTLKPGGRICLMGVSGAENNEFFSSLGAAGGANLQKTLEAGKAVAVAHSLEEAGFIHVATKDIRALVTIDDPSAYWSAMRGVLNLPAQPMPADVSQRIPPGTRLSVSLYFARGVKRDPAAAELAVPKTFDEFVGATKRAIREINPMGIKEEFRKAKAVFVDVRDQNSVTASIRDSIAVSRDQLEREIPLQIPQHDTNIVTYCANGTDGVLAASQLEKMGYTNVWNLQGGMAAWTFNGMPTL